MGSVFTTAGQARINELIGDESNLVIDRMVLALIPDLDPADPIDRGQQMPDPGDIVHTYTIDEEHKGYITPDQVVYSMLLGAGVGDFSFNWIGLVEAVTDTVIAITTTPEISKWATDLATNTTGNAITRNMMLSFQDAQAVTGITITAETWQFDFSAEFNAHTNMELDPADDDAVKNRHLSNAQGKKWEDHVDDTVLHRFFPQGTSMLFAQAAAPAGWTKKADWANVAALHVGNNYAEGGGDSPRSYTTDIGIANHANHAHSGPNHRHTGPLHSHDIIVPKTGWGTSSQVGDGYLVSHRWDISNATISSNRTLISSNAGNTVTGYSGTGNTGSAGAASHNIDQSTYTPRFVQVIAAIKD